MCVCVRMILYAQRNVAFDALTSTDAFFIVMCVNTHTHATHNTHTLTSLASRLHFPSAQSFFLLQLLFLSFYFTFYNPPNPLYFNLFFQDYFFFLIKMLYYHVYGIHCSILHRVGVLGQ